MLAAAQVAPAAAAAMGAAPLPPVAGPAAAAAVQLLAALPIGDTAIEATFHKWCKERHNVPLTAVWPSQGEARSELRAALHHARTDGGAELFPLAARESIFRAIDLHHQHATHREQHKLYVVLRDQFWSYTFFGCRGATAQVLLRVLWLACIFGGCSRFRGYWASALLVLCTAIHSRATPCLKYLGYLSMAIAPAAGPLYRSTLTSLGIDPTLLPFDAAVSASPTYLLLNIVMPIAISASYVWVIFLMPAEAIRLSWAAAAFLYEPTHETIFLFFEVKSAVHDAAVAAALLLTFGPIVITLVVWLIRRVCSAARQFCCRRHDPPVEAVEVFAGCSPQDAVVRQLKEQFGEDVNASKPEDPEVLLPAGPAFQAELDEILFWNLPVYNRIRP